MAPDLVAMKSLSTAESNKFSSFSFQELTKMVKSFQVMAGKLEPLISMIYTVLRYITWLSIILITLLKSDSSLTNLETFQRDISLFESTNYFFTVIKPPRSKYTNFFLKYSLNNVTCEVF